MKPKILIITNLYPPYVVGGYEIACHDTVQVLRSFFDVTIATAYKPDAEISDEPNVHRCFKLFNYFGTSDRTFSVKDVEKHNVSALESILKTLAPDLIYYWNTNGLGVQIIEVCNKLNLKSLFHFMDESILDCQSSLRRRISLILKRRQYPIFNYNGKIENAIFISNYIAGRYGQHYKIKKSRTIYPYVNFSQIEYKKEYRKKEVISGVFVGQIEPHKGIYELCQFLEKYQQCHETKIKLHIYGKSSCGLDQKIAKEFSTLVEIKQGFSRSQILTDLHKYDVGFFPSKWEEPFGIAQIELMAAGLPVFSTGKGGSKEVLSDTNSILFNLNNYSDFESKILDIWTFFDTKGKHIGESARKDIESRFCPSTYQNLVKNFILELLGPK